ncbi:SulP family inorganic anion transporter [Streptomyces canus]|uniref:SulP family inorganic anion transporter n=1 Tax=Streptomyces canus TaxID=58343 RepID=UPI0036A0CA76
MTTGQGIQRVMGPLRAVPGVRALSDYRRAWLVRDVVAGIALTTLLVPQGMAYAELAGLPPITGLYTTALCLLGDAVCGLGPMIAATTVVPLVAADGDPRPTAALASMLASTAAGVMLLASVARLGFKVDADDLVGVRVGLVGELADGATVPAVAAPMTYVDTTAADVLHEPGTALDAAGVHLVSAGLKDPVRRKMERYGLTRTHSAPVPRQRTVTAVSTAVGSSVQPLGGR